MLVSLFEYWRAFPFTQPQDQFVMSARVGTFPEFLDMAVVRGCSYSYEAFFDVGGPAWSSTRLIDFRTIETGLKTVCQEFGIASPHPLLYRNQGPTSGRGLEPYRLAAGLLMTDVHRHFRWYYTSAAQIMVRGADPLK